MIYIKKRLSPLLFVLLFVVTQLPVFAGGPKHPPVEYQDPGKSDSNEIAPPSAQDPTAHPTANGVSYDYGRMFTYARELLTRPQVKTFLKHIFAEELTVSEEMQKRFGFPEKLTDLSESQFVLLLQRNPKLWKALDQYLAQVPEIKEGNKKQEALRKEWREKFTSLLEDKGVLDDFKKFNDPTEPMPLHMPNGEPGYRNFQMHATHETMQNGRVVPPGNLRQVWIDFIRGTKKQFSFNVYDFDLMEVADAMIEIAKQGKTVEGGIDAGVIKSRPEVKAVFDKLNAQKGITIKAVDAVGLNHQKMATRDWETPEIAAVLLSSGNLTQSCIGPEGDLVARTDRPAYSIPNANNIITMDSPILSQVIKHELTKTLEMGLRGKEYPLGGAYAVFGPKKPNGEVPKIVIAFSPHGGLGNLNNDMISQVILRTRGRIRMLQFAFSSKTVENALYERAKLELKEGHEFDFASVGDKPFAMRDWSVFLDMSGYSLDPKDKNKTYVEDQKNEWKKLLGEEGFKKLQAAIKVAPPNYGTHEFTPPEGGEAIEVTAKIHHKVLVSGNASIIGTSFNYSENAVTNNEQLVVVYDSEVAEQTVGMYEGLNRQTHRTVAETAVRRNDYGKKGESDPEEAHEHSYIGRDEDMVMGRLGGGEKRGSGLKLSPAYCGKKLTEPAG